MLQYKLIKRVIFITLLFVLTLLFSCKKEFDLLNEVPVVTVGCFLKQNDTIKVYLTYTKQTDKDFSYYPAFDFVANADVYIYEENILKEKLTHIKQGYYKSLNYLPVENKKYQIKINVPGFDTISAETFIPKFKDLDTIYYENIDKTELDDDFEYYFARLNIKFTDNKNEKNLYMINMFNWWTYYQTDDILIKEIISANSYFGAREIFFTDDFLNGQNYNMQIDAAYNGNDSVNIVMDYCNISEEMYEFLKTKFLLQKTYDNPLAEPVIIYSNIINGTGIFAGYSFKSYNFTCYLDSIN